MTRAGDDALARENLGRQLSLPAVGEDECGFLRACLAPPAAAAAAWRGLLDGPGRGGVPGSSVAPGLRALLPLLAWRAGELSPPAPAGFAAQLRAARAIELRRNEALREIAASLLGHPALAGTGALVLGGLGLAEAAWPEPTLRHGSRLALLLPSRKAAAAAADRLIRDGMVEGRQKWIGTGLRLKHPSGMPVILHGGSCAAPALGLRFEKLTARGVLMPLNTVTMCCSDPAANVILTAIQGLRSAAGGDLLWLADAVFLLRRFAGQVGEQDDLLRRPLARRLAGRLVLVAAGIDSSLSTGSPFQPGPGPATATESRLELFRAVAALRGLRAAVAAIPTGGQRVAWLLRLAPHLAADWLRGRVSLRLHHQGM